jgi:tetratricopeptide (TPR) repeat protein
MFITREHLQHSGVHRDGQAVRLSLCMIVRDNAATLRPCLASIRPWVDEMIVVDTGSKDETPSIAQEYGARLFHFPWCDDFSAARNESLRHARGEWLFWMDSDDTITPENGRKLRDLANGPHPVGIVAYVMQVHCPMRSGEGFGGLTVVDHIKLFRNHPRIRFEFRIHEQVLPSIRRLGGEVAWTDIFVDHSGSDQTEAGRRRKYECDLRILQLELAEKPDHPFVLFNLGMTHADMGEHATAEEFLRHCLSVSRPDESHVRKAYALLVVSLQEQDRLQDAWTANRQGLELFPADPELLFLRGTLAHRLGRRELAAEAYRGALANRDQPHFSSLDPGVLGYKARHNLALVLQELGRHDLAEVQWRHVIAEAPAFPDAYRCLGESLVAQGKYHGGEVHVDNMARQPPLRPCAAVLKARLAEARGELSAAKSELENARREFPHSLEVLQAQAKFLFERGDACEAEEPLRRLIELCPNDGAARHNLGVLNLRAGNPVEAAHWFRESLRVRPHCPATREQLSMLGEEGKGMVGKGIG